MQLIDGTESDGGVAGTVTATITGTTPSGLIPRTSLIPSLVVTGDDDNLQSSIIQLQQENQEEKQQLEEEDTIGIINEAFIDEDNNTIFDVDHNNVHELNNNINMEKNQQHKEHKQKQQQKLHEEEKQYQLNEKMEVSLKINNGVNVINCKDNHQIISNNNKEKKMNGSGSPTSSSTSMETIYTIQTSKSVFLQMLIPFMIAGIGSVFAGVVLNTVSKWKVFVDIPQLSIMISAFLGLIGNIETTLASRLSTQANLGHLDTWHGIIDIISGNFMVIQCQASTVGLFAAFCSLAISTIREETRNKISSKSILLLCTTSVTTSIISNTFISTMIIAVILLARRANINPDNISTPVAASMGDVCTIYILANVSHFLYELQMDYSVYIQSSLMMIGLCLAPIFGYFARRNRWTRSVIYTGWTAILGAVIIEQPGGVVMENAFGDFPIMSTFQPLVNGIGSNLVGIQTSRMSTFLHASALKGQLPESHPTWLVSPWFVFFSKDLHARMARLLMMVLIPAHLFYIMIIKILSNSDIFHIKIVLTFPFISLYCLAVTIQLLLLLYLAYLSVFWAWKKRINPDNSAIPFTSALADVLGNSLMALTFSLLFLINDPNGEKNIGGGGGDDIRNLTTITMTPTTTMMTDELQRFLLFNQTNNNNIITADNFINSTIINSIVNLTTTTIAGNNETLSTTIMSIL